MTTTYQRRLARVRAAMAEWGADLLLLNANMCFTLEPKVWQPGEFYVRCEDVVVGPDGARSMTHAPYEPNVVA